MSMCPAKTQISLEWNYQGIVQLKTVQDLWYSAVELDLLACNPGEVRNRTATAAKDQVNHVTKKPVFESLRPGKAQTGLLEV